jgi:actin related protein 2/3 complex subunit 2
LNPRINREPFYSEKPEALDMTIVDFDGVLYHLSTPTSKTDIQISFKWRCFPELINYGANDILQREYGSMLVTPPQQGFDVTLNVDLTSLPQEAGMDKLNHSCMCRHCALTVF